MMKSVYSGKVFVYVSRPDYRPLSVQVLNEATYFKRSITPHGTILIPATRPPEVRCRSNFSHPTKDEQLYDQFLSGMQRLRGSIYLQDGAIKPWELDDEGRTTCKATSRAGICFS